jgi:hypothetical protein
MANKQRIAKTATIALVILWEDGFFHDWRKMEAVAQELSKRHHHFSDAALGMALKDADHLTRRGKRGAFEYVQKYPFVAGGGESAPKKRGKK